MFALYEMYGGGWLVPLLLRLLVHRWEMRDHLRLILSLLALIFPLAITLYTVGCFHLPSSSVLEVSTEFSEGCKTFAYTSLLSLKICLFTGEILELRKILSAIPIVTALPHASLSNFDIFIPLICAKVHFPDLE